nr:uncharacterized protein LOC129387024 [Dermacentor andersoni]
MSYDLLNGYLQVSSSVDIIGRSKSDETSRTNYRKTTGPIGWRKRYRDRTQPYHPAEHISKALKIKQNCLKICVFFSATNKIKMQQNKENLCPSMIILNKMFASSFFFQNGTLQTGPGLSQCAVATAVTGSGLVTVNRTVVEISIVWR